MVDSQPRLRWARQRCDEFVAEHGRAATTSEIQHVGKKNGSASYGRRRLLQILREFQLYDQAIGQCQSHYLDTPDVPAGEKIKALRLLGCSAAITDDEDSLALASTSLGRLIGEQESKREKLSIRIARLEAATDKSKDRPPRPLAEKVDAKKAKLQIKEKKKELAKVKPLIDQIQKAQLAIEGYSLVLRQEYKLAHKKLTKATGEDVSWLGELEFRGGDTDQGLEKVKKQVDRRRNEVIPLARLAYMQYENGDIDLAKETFEKLRETSTSMDLEIPMFARLRPLAEEIELESDWRKPRELAADLGFRPVLDSLGPFRWSPPAAPKWTLADSENQNVGSSEFDGQPHLVIFYLGHGCLHCAEQLQKFAPRVADFENAGIEVIAISSDGEAGLQDSIANFEGEMPFRLASNESLDVFKKFRAYDDFEGQALHGTFLVDGEGRIRWQDISYQPFMDDDFLLDEAKRLLADELGKKPVASTLLKRETVAQAD